MDLTKERDFLARIDGFSTGGRAVLRRACGRTLEQADSSALATFYSVLPGGLRLNDEEGWFEGACLRCMWRPDEEENIPAEQALAKLAEKQDKDDDPYKRRLIALLDTPRDADGYMAIKLWRMIKLLKQKGYIIDCAVLISDICRWNQSSRYVQKKWARAFCLSDQPEKDKIIKN